MKESLWGYYLALLGITVSTVMIMVSNMTTTNQQNYYLLKEVTNAAMIDAIDYAYYREYGTVKINTEKFVENFLRRFSEGISKTNTYKIDFYSIYENPPSVSIKVTSNTGDYNIAGDSTNIDVVNSIDAVLEANNEVTISKLFFSLPWGKCEESDYISPDNKRCRLMSRLQINVDFIEKELGIPDFDPEKLEVVNTEFLYVEDNPKNVDEYTLAYGYKSEESTTETKSIEETSKSTSKETSSIQNFYNYGGSNADVKPLVDGAGASYETAKNFFSTDVQNVNLSVVKNGENFFLAHGLDYTCGKAAYKRWRLKDFYYSKSENKYLNESDYNRLSDTEKNKYINLLNQKAKPEGVDMYHWPPEVHEEIYNNASGVVEDKSYYTKASYYDGCLIGIWYKVDFKYNSD